MKENGFDLMEAYEIANGGDEVEWVDHRGGGSSYGVHIKDGSLTWDNSGRAVCMNDRFLTGWRKKIVYGLTFAEALRRVFLMPGLIMDSPAAEAPLVALEGVLRCGDDTAVVITNAMVKCKWRVY